MSARIGSLHDHDRLCEAWDGHLDAEAAFDGAPTPESEQAATRAYIRLVSAACAVDPHALRAPSIRQWIERRVALYRKTCALGWRGATGCPPRRTP